jgi:3-oxoadipate enol-lactonase
MPMIDADGCPINVKVEGPDNAPVLMLSNSLATDMSMWDPQVPEFTSHYRLVRYDRRGHGRSGVSKGPYTIAQLGHDVLAILDHLGIKKTNWCGLSMGGMVGQWLAANAPDRFEKMVFANTHYYYAAKDTWHERLGIAREKGLKALVDSNMERWFTAGFREREPKTIDWMKAMFVATPVEGFIACGEAVRDMDHRELLGRINVPVHMIAGRQDPATPLAANEYIRAHIPGATMTVLEAAHISNVEQPEAFTKAVLDYLGAR